VRKQQISTGNICITYTIQTLINKKLLASLHTVAVFVLPDVYLHTKHFCD